MNIFIRIMVSLAIIMLCLLLGKAMIESKPEEKVKKQVDYKPLVDTVEVSLGNYRPKMIGYGTVQSYFETQLTPEVSGKIQYISPRFKVGEMMKSGETLVVIDDSDYQSELATRKAQLILQQSALAEEEVRAGQAKADWVASGRALTSASDFVLRKPQLAAAEANVDAARIAIEKAEVDLKRTTIVVPYDAVVTKRSASLGSYVGVQSSLGALIATEKAEVRIPLTADQMERIRLVAGESLAITLVSPSDARLKWDAEIVRMEPLMDMQNQVSYVIGEVSDPYTNSVGVLPVGSFVNIEIPVAEIKDALKVPESALVNDTYIWLVDGDHLLVKQEVERIQSDKYSAYVKVVGEGVKFPLKLITRPLSNYKPGMEVVEVAEESEVKKN